MAMRRIATRKGWVASVAVLLLTASAPSTAGVAIRIDTDAPLGPVNQSLVGFGWHDGGAPLTSIAPLRPTSIRLDASLEQVSPSPRAALRLAPLLDRVARIRAIGAEPLVILSYVPAWLGRPLAFGRDPTRVRPADLDAWERLVHDVVFALATADASARRFEAWNEPDIPIFWQDTPLAWVETAARSARAVAAVERETGIDLEFGGPATAVPDPAYLLPFLTRFRDPSLPLDFVSWHYYGNYPFLGPDGAEFPLTAPVHPLIGRRNPLTSPSVFAPQAPLVRLLTDVALLGSGRPRPALVLDEWNLSAGGFDRRHDTAAGAAFAAGSLIEMQDSGLDAAAFFEAVETRGVRGEHGAVRLDGTVKPVWWTFALWRQLAPTRVAVTGAGDGIWVLASTGVGRVTILVAAFDARAGGRAARPITLRLDGDGTVRSATLRRIDNRHAAADIATPLAVAGRAVRFRLPSPGVALVEVRTGPATIS
jgi:hypothetical protein